MKTYRIIPLLFLLLLTACGQSDIDSPIHTVNNDPETVNTLEFDQDKIAEYRQIAKELGFNYDQEYYYTAFVELQKSKGLGLAGRYEYFPSSSGDLFISLKALNGWEFVYYKNADVTMIYQIRHNEERTNSYVRLLKLANGRVPDLDTL
jgi:hypothetical protein